MFAVIKTGGKQYKVCEGQKLRVEKLPAEVDSNAEFKEVLLIEKDGNLEIGKPFIDGAVVEVVILAHGKADKVTNFKYKPKKGFKKRKGHRQLYTEIEIKAIKN